MTGVDSSKTIGVLALQGAYALHQSHIESLGAKYQEVRTAKDLQLCDGLILPGGESSTILRLIEYKGLWNDLENFLNSKPSWGICAGAILLASKVSSHEQKSFQVLPMTISRNGYGRQLDSHEGLLENYKVSWIRAPKIQDFSEDLDILCTHGEQVVGVRGRQAMATTFHPELNFQSPSPWHQSFLQLIESHQVH